MGEVARDGAVGDDVGGTGAAGVSDGRAAGESSASEESFRTEWTMREAKCNGGGTNRFEAPDPLSFPEMSLPAGAMPSCPNPMPLLPREALMCPPNERETCVES